MAESKLRVLTLNLGSSSLRTGVFTQVRDGLERTLTLEVDGIGAPGATMAVDGNSHPLAESEGKDHRTAVRLALQNLRTMPEQNEVCAVGHRIVHGGERYAAPAPITHEMVDYLQSIVRLDPAHLPQSLDAIAATREVFPDTPQFAAFDTAFHHNLPLVARTFPIPRAKSESGIRRYGFHGLSYEYVMRELREIDSDAAQGRVLIAHLGNGSSMAAVRKGQCIDTTMGLTPAGGLMMGTRTGDIDPGVLFALAGMGMSVADLERMVNQESGLKGVAGASDMRELLEQRERDSRADEAIDMYCYSALKFAGALAAALGGLDTFVFTGGIGEHAAPIRSSICSGLAFAGVRLDEDRNAANAGVISTDGSGVVVRVVRTDEELMVARHTITCLKQEAQSNVDV